MLFYMGPGSVTEDRLETASASSRSSEPESLDCKPCRMMSLI